MVGLLLVMTASATIVNGEEPNHLYLPIIRNDPTPTPTWTPIPTATNTPVPTATDTPIPTSTWTPVPTNTPVPTQPPTGPCLCYADLYNCSDFSTHAQAQACYNWCISQGAGDIHKLDRDGDGDVCESLPRWLSLAKTKSKP